MNLCLELSLPSAHSLPSQNYKQQKTEYQEPAAHQQTKVVERASLQPGSPIIGPAIITENVATTWLKEGWSAEIDQYGHLRLKTR